MSICDGCIHDDVCGLEDNHEEGIVSCADRMPKNVLDKIRAEIEQITSRYTISRERCAIGQVEWSDRLIKESEVLEILDKYKAETEQVGNPDRLEGE